MWPLQVQRFGAVRHLFWQRFTRWYKRAQPLLEQRFICTRYCGPTLICCTLRRGGVALTIFAMMQAVATEVSLCVLVRNSVSATGYE